ncbi:MAG: amidophosphoribosyltransferase [Planctomycetales bacterium]|nr:amidophosphoribosyltransferase [Planctomycetales bacterium]
MCGILGVVAPRDVAADLYEGLLTLQHRGQDAAGFCTWDETAPAQHDLFPPAEAAVRRSPKGEGGLRLVKGGGLVEQVLAGGDAERLKGRSGIAHVRYPTAGVGSPEDAQPFAISTPLPIAMAHNGNVTNCASLRPELAGSGRPMRSGCDVEALLHVFAEELPERPGGIRYPDDLFTAVAGVFHRVRGAYTVVALVAGRGLLAFRDPFGIRPGILGTREGPHGRAVAVASESVALDRLDFKVLRDLAPGEAVFVDLSGEIASKQVAPGELHPCIFEHVYFARPDSFLDKVSVYKARMRLGESLARQVIEAGLDPDVVIPVPDTARPAAQACAARLGLPYREGLQKNRYVGRTFIMPGQERRDASVRRKLNPIPIEFEKKRVLLVDDSLVRGTTSRALVEMARRAGAVEVYLALTAPPLTNPCVYGIDMSTSRDLIARDHTVEELRALVGADALLYQRIEDLVEAGRRGNPEVREFCTGCFNGRYASGDVTAQTLREIESERLAASVARAGRS